MDRLFVVSCLETKRRGLDRQKARNKMCNLFIIFVIFVLLFVNL